MRLKNLFLLCILLAGCNNTPMIETAKDESGPYINMKQYEFTTERGNRIDFSNISGYDDIDGLLPTKVKGYIDYTRIGDYYPSVICTDLSGNETSVTITVHVVEVGAITNLTENENVVVLENGCDVSGALDPSLPCESVLESELEKYEMVYSGTNGNVVCEKELDDEHSCEVIFRNDGTLWGYGRTDKKEESE